MVDVAIIIGGVVVCAVRRNHLDIMIRGWWLLLERAQDFKIEIDGLSPRAETELQQKRSPGGSSSPISATLSRLSIRAPPLPAAGLSRTRRVPRRRGPQPQPTDAEKGVGKWIWLLITS